MARGRVITRPLEAAPDTQACDRCGSALCLEIARNGARLLAEVASRRGQHFADPGRFGVYEGPANVCPSTNRARLVGL